MNNCTVVRDDIENKPLITFAIVTYKQTAFIKEAILGAFGQTYSPLEIIISDDHSTDGTFDSIKQMASSYEGPHQVLVRQNEVNLGLAEHVNKVMLLARGEIIVIAAGDDISLPNRTSAIYEAYIRSGKTAMSLFSQAIKIDEAGKPIEIVDVPDQIVFPDYKSLAQHKVTVLGASHAWHRCLFEVFGPIGPDVISEDAVIAFRASLLGKIAPISDVLVQYRHHKHNIWLHPAKSNFIAYAQWQHSKHEVRTKNQCAIWEMRLKDINRLSETSIEASSLAENLRPWIVNGLNDAQLEYQYIHSRFHIRIMILIKASRRGVSIRRVLRWILQYEFSTLYYSILYIRMILNQRNKRII